MKTNQLLTVDNFDINKVSFGKPHINTKYKYPEVNVFYDGYDLSLKTPLLTVATVWVDKDPLSKKATIELSVNENITNVLTKFDNKIVEYVSDNSIELLNYKKQVSKEVVEIMYPGSIKQPKEDKYKPTFRVAVYKKSDQWDFECHDENKNVKFIDDISDIRSCEILALVKCTGVKIIGNSKVSITWKLTNMRIFPRKRTNNIDRNYLAMVPIELTNLNFDNITFASPKVTSSNMKTVYINVTDDDDSKKSLVLQTPYMYAPFGISWDDKYEKYTLNLSFRDIESDPEVKSLFDFITTLESRVKTESSSWFKQGVTASMKSKIYPSEKYAPTIGISVPHNNTVIKVETTEKGQPCELDLTKTEGAKISAKIVCTSAYVNTFRNEFGITFKVVSMDIVPTEKNVGPLDVDDVLDEDVEQSVYQSDSSEDENISTNVDESINENNVDVSIHDDL
jgi:hypothetical protein